MMPVMDDPWPFSGLDRNRYGVILADPPWRFEVYSEKGEGRSPKYARMTLDDVQALPVADLAAPDCVLLLWVVNPMLPHGLEVMRAWGFTFKTIAFCWAKTTKRSWATWTPNFHMGLGYWSRQNIELCLLGTRGRPKRTGKGVRQLMVEPLREHSRKPDETFRRIEALVPGPYCELFSRQPRPGWDTWGLEREKFEAAA